MMEVEFIFESFDSSFTVEYGKYDADPSDLRRIKQNWKYTSLQFAILASATEVDGFIDSELPSNIISPCGAFRRYRHRSGNKGSDDYFLVRVRPMMRIQHWFKSVCTHMRCAPRSYSRLIVTRESNEWH